MNIVVILCDRYSAEEIEEKVNTFRLMLQERQEPAPPPAERPVWVSLQSIQTEIKAFFMAFF